MLILTAALCVLGGILLFIGGIMLLVAAFRISVLWGLAVLFLPFASLVFLFAHWSNARRAFAFQLGGLLLFGAGFGLGAGQELSGLWQMTADLPLSMPRTSPSPERQPAIEDPDALTKDAAPTEPNAPLEPAKPKEDPKTLVGKTFAEAERLFGKPRGSMRTQDRMSVFYEGFWLYSENGQTISDVELDAEFKALRAVVPPPPDDSSNRVFTTKPPPTT